MSWQSPESRFGKQARGDLVGGEELLRQPARSPAMPRVISVDGVDGRHRFLHGAVTEQAFSHRVGLAETGILRDHGLSTRQVAGVPFAEPPAPQPDVLVLGN